MKQTAELGQKLCKQYLHRRYQLYLNYNSYLCTGKKIHINIYFEQKILHKAHRLQIKNFCNYQGSTEKGQGREGENGEKSEEKKEGKDGQGKGSKDGELGHRHRQSSVRVNKKHPVIKKQ